MMNIIHRRRFNYTW